MGRCAGQLSVLRAAAALSVAQGCEIALQGAQRGGGLLGAAAGEGMHLDGHGGRPRILGGAGAEEVLDRGLEAAGGEAGWVDEGQRDAEGGGAGGEDGAAVGGDQDVVAGDLGVEGGIAQALVDQGRWMGERRERAERAQQALPQGDASP